MIKIILSDNNGNTKTFDNVNQLTQFFVEDGMTNNSITTINDLMNVINSSKDGVNYSITISNEDKLTTVFTVDQTQPTEGYDNQTIYVTSTRKEAERRCRELNKEYGYGCIFSKEGDFEDIKEEADSYHYYTVGSFYVDEPMAPNYK